MNCVTRYHEKVVKMPVHAEVSWWIRGVCYSVGLLLLIFFNFFCWNIWNKSRMADPTKESVVKEYTLEKDCELRFEIESKIQVVVEVCNLIAFHKICKQKWISRQLKDLRFAEIFAVFDIVILVFHRRSKVVSPNCMELNWSSLKSTHSLKELKLQSFLIKDV